ncbi:MAG: beta strand repeat-containing protein [Phycisphaerales bacterium]
MNRTQRPTSGRSSIFGGTHEEGTRFTPRRLAGRAGRATESWTDQSAFDHLEKRQLLFALTPLVGQADFAYTTPFLFRQVPAFTAPVRTDYNFDFMPVAPTPIPSGSIIPPAGANMPPIPFLRLEHTNFGANQAAFPQLLAIGRGATQEDGEITMPITGTRTVTFSRVPQSGVGNAILRAFEMEVVLPGAGAVRNDGNMPDPDPMPADQLLAIGNIRVELLLRGQVVATFDEQGTDQDLSDAGAQTQTMTPTTTRFRFETNLPTPDFDQVRFTAVGAGDAFDILAITTEEPPGMFADWIDELTFGGRAAFAGPINGAVDPGANAHPNAPIRRTVAEIFDNDTGALNRRLSTPETFASGVRVTPTNYTPANGPQIITGPGGPADRALSVDLVGTQAVSLSFVDALGNARPMTQFSFAVPNAGAQTLGAGTQIELLRFGRVVRTYVQADFDDPNVRLVNGQDATQDLYILDTITGTPSFDVDNTTPLIAGFGAAFDEVRISRVGQAGTDAGGILIDRISPFAPSMAEFFDIYGRPIRPTIESIATDTNPVPLIDVNDDGVPDYNDGIGRIIISNGGGTTNLTLYGGDIVFDPMLGYQFVPIDDTLGNFDDYEDAGFGFLFDPQSTDGSVIGLPIGPGSVLVGAPFFRDNSSPVAYHGVDPTDASRMMETPSIFPFHADGTPMNNFADGTPINPIFDLPLTLASDFSNPHTGITSPMGTNVGAVTIHGAVFGQNTFGGAVTRFNVGTLLGSLLVNGDIGTLAVASDSGMYFVRPQNTNPPDDARGTFAVGSTINILRTSGSMYFGQRNAARITVFADINNASLGRVSFLNYAELEAIPAFGPGVMNPEQVWNGSVLGAVGGGAPLLFGERGYRNDTIHGAEFVNNSGSFTSVSGALGNLNDLQVEDEFDFYAFAALAGRTVTFDAVFDQNGQSAQQFAFDILNSEGVTVASQQAPSQSPNSIPGSVTAFRLTFTPRADDVYYLRINIAILDGGAQSTLAYTVGINGLASVGSGMVAFSGSSTNFTEIRTSLGFIRHGAGIVGDDSNDSASGNAAIDTIEVADDFQDPHGGQLLVQGNLFQAAFASDVIALGPYVINGNLGSFRVGTFYRVGTSSDLAVHGDVDTLTLRVGGRIGLIEVLGDFAGDRDTYLGGAPAPGGPVNIQTGLTPGADGSIGEIRIAGVMYGDTTTITVFGSQSRLSGLTVGGGILLGAPRITFPDGGSLGPVDLPTIPDNRPGIIPNPNAFRLPLLFNQPLSLTAASGVSYTITISGGIASQDSAGSVLLLPVFGAPGAALSRIDVTLLGGATLNISTSTLGKLDIGAIAITTGPSGATGLPRNSDILIGGVGEIDVSGTSGITQVPLPGAGNLGRIVNATVNGDILLIDVTGVNEVAIAGNLGRTDDPLRRGRFTEAQVGGMGASAVGGLVPISQTNGGQMGLMSDAWNGRLQVLPRDPAAAGGTYASSIGSPIDTELAGLIVRSGNVNRVVVAGAVADVMLLDTGADAQGQPLGTLTTLIVNSDGLTGSTGFDGIVGNIFVNNVLNIDVGQGLRGRTDSPLPEASIIANGHIGTVGGRNAIISGLIVAGQIGPAPRGLQTGINSITLNGGLIDNAYIFTGEVQSFFASPLTFVPRAMTRADLPSIVGNVRGISLTNASLFRSQVAATTVGAINITGGAFDASIINGLGSVGIIRASEFRNSTRTGEPLEYRQSQIFGSVAIGGISSTGDISDLVAITDGNLTGGIIARNMTRLDLTVAQRMGLVNATNDIRSSTFTVGNLAFLRTGGDLRSTSINVAGPVGSVFSSGEITNTSIRSVGGDGRIISISALGNISGSFTAAGPISSITSSRGSVMGTITTTDPTDGDLFSVFAGGDVGATFNIARNISSIRATGNIGRPQAADGSRDVIDVSGTIASISAGGQLYADVRGGSTIASITAGRVAGLPGNDQVGDPIITAFGRISSVSIFGDFNGSVVSFSGGIGSFRVINGSFRIGNDDNNNGVIDLIERNRIEARDGNIDAVTIANGNLFGNVLAPDGDIRSVSVTGAGAFGRIGIDPALSTTVAVPFDTFRNQLPPGTPSTAGFGGTAAFDGPTISAGGDIFSVLSTSGMFETGIFAGRNINSVLALGGVNTDGLGAITGSSFIAAGQQILNILARGNVRGLDVVAGVQSLGADGRTGGIGADADTLRSGSITTVTVLGGSDTVNVVAGVNAGTDGLYNTSDGDNSETAVPGASTIGRFTVSGAIVATTAFADANAGTGTAGIVRSTGALPADARTFSGSTAGFVPITTFNQAIVTTFGETATVTFSGPGQAFWDAPNNRIVLINSTIGSTLRITATGAGATLTNFGIVSNDDAALASLIINGNLRSATASDTVDRNSRLFIDGNVSTFMVGNVVITADATLPGSGILFVGGNLNFAMIGTPGTFAAPAPANQFRLEVQGNLLTAMMQGDFGTSIASRIDAANITSVIVTGAIRGVVSSARDITIVRASEAIIGGRIRAGNNISTVFSKGATSLARISAGGNITSVVFTSDVTDTTILAGTDLGTDGTFGGAGLAADRTTNGNVTSVTVIGNFFRSDVTAGVARGADGFINTADDVVADGRSSITVVRVTGNGVGSPVNGQRYGIVSNGTAGTAIVGTAILGTGAVGNFSKVALSNRPTPILITDIRVSDRAPRLYTARLTVNQELDASTINAALSINEVRGVAGLQTLVPLVSGVDYTIRYDAPSNTIFVDFVEGVTTRNMVGMTPGALPGPGVFRFELDAAVLRGATSNARLDGNSDGAITGGTDDYSDDVIVGDAGDRLFSGRAFLNVNSVVDLYGPASLDVLMDANRNADGLPDVNRPYTLRGILGDHPDANTGTFGPGGDVDLFTLTLRAGQILNLSQIMGTAFGADLAILDSTGAPVFSVYDGAVGGQLQLLGSLDPNATTSSLLVRVSDTYTIAILPPVQTQAGPRTDIAGFPPLPLFPTFDLTDATTAPGGPTAIGSVGDYSVVIEITEDGDSGFLAGLPGALDAAVTIGNVPLPIMFTGGDNLFDTADDQPFAVVNDDNPLNPQYFVQLFAGPDNMLGTGDDVVFGGNGFGVFISLTAGGDMMFGTGDDVLTLTRTILAAAAPVDPDMGGPLEAVPVPNDFRGLDNMFNTPDDLAVVNRASTAGAGFTYSLLAGADGIRGTADDIVTGSTGQGGSISSRTSGVDMMFGTGDDVIQLLADTGTATTVINASLLPSDFAGLDNTLGTADDLASIVIGGYTFTLSRGTNNRLDGNGTPILRSDDIITGANNVTGRYARVASTRTAGADGQFGTADDVFTSLADGAIGAPGRAGVPNSGQADVDVYQLNGGATIAPGTRVRATLKVSEIGGNLGQFRPTTQTFGATTFESVIDTRGLVQFALFDTSSATGIADANLVAAASRVLAIGGQAGQTVTDGSTTYGFNSDGDFFMEFAIPARIDDPMQAGTFALYVQGVVQSDYQLEIVTSGTAALPAGPQMQNVLIEVTGGVIPWLEANPYMQTLLGAADPAVSGFSGTLGAANLPAAEYFTQQLVQRLQAIFTAAGINVVVSSNAADFEGQDFSTVYVTGSEQPAAFVNNGTFGASEHVDLFNADRNDDAVVYLSSLNVLGNTAGQAGADNFINQLTAAVGRRIGELIGVRGTSPTGASPNTDLMAANSPRLVLPNGGVYEFNNASRPLARPGSGLTDTQFFLGNQLTLPLLQRIFGV